MCIYIYTYMYILYIHIRLEEKFVEHFCWGSLLKTDSSWMELSKGIPLPSSFMVGHILQGAETSTKVCRNALTNSLQNSRKTVGFQFSPIHFTVFPLSFELGPLALGFGQPPSVAVKLGGSMFQPQKTFGSHFCSTNLPGFGHFGAN